MEEIKKLLQQKRPNLSTTSIVTYTSMLKNLLRKMDKTLEYVLKHPKEVLDFIKDTNRNTKKTMLALLVALTDNDQYRKAMVQLAEETKAETEKQEKTDKQKANWLEWNEVVDHYNFLYKKAMPLWKKSSLTAKERDELMDVVILSLYVLLPPRRSTDYVKLKVRHANPTTDNTIVKNKLVFNEYKTDKTYGRQEVKLPPKLKTLLTKWMNKHDNDYLLFDRQGRPLTNSKLTLRMNKIFNGKKISSSMLRHIWISEKFKNAPTLKEMKETAEQMGHSVEEQQLYRKL